MSDRERYQQYLCSREWGLLREQVRRRCGGICERCKNAPMSHVHHLTYIRKYAERLDDLQGLCEPCHEFTHGLRKADPVNEAIDPVTKFLSTFFVRGGRADERFLIMMAKHKGINSRDLFNKKYVLDIKSEFVIYADGNTAWFWVATPTTIRLLRDKTP